MRGKRNIQESMFACVRLEDLIPPDHILRRVEQRIDLTFIDAGTRELYSLRGRPSIDPQVLIRMMMVGYLFGITSERRLCEEVQLNLAYRWFCGLSLEDKVPDHSTFSKNRHGRFAHSTLFRGMFYSVVEQAMAAGLVKGQHLTVDATTVAANASLESLEPIVVPMSPQAYLEKIDKENSWEQKETQEKDKPPSPAPRISNETHLSQSDPDCRLLAKPFQKTLLAYSDNVLMDNASRVIIDVEVTQPNLHQEGQVAAQMVSRSRFRLGLEPKSVGGDKAYGYGAAAGALLRAGVDPHVPQVSVGSWNTEGIFSKKEFHYDEKADEMICPAGKPMHRRTQHLHNRQIEYRARVRDCRLCLLKARCTRARYRVVHRHWDQAALDRAAQLRLTPEYVRSQRARKKIEHLFAEAKEQMGLRRARRRGKGNLTEQCLMTALVQNIKRILKASETIDGRPTNAMQETLQLTVTYLSRLLCRIAKMNPPSAFSNPHRPSSSIA